MSNINTILSSAGCPVFILLIVLVVLLLKRCKKTCYNLVNIHIVTATGGLLLIFTGIGLLISLITSPQFEKSDISTNGFLIYVCIGLIILGIASFIFNVTQGYKGLASVGYALINLIIQFLIGCLCIMTFSIALFVIMFVSKKIVDDM